jgi:hypothetical protein
VKSAVIPSRADVTDFILCKDYGNLRAGVLAATCAMTVIGGEVVYEATR